MAYEMLLWDYPALARRNYYLQRAASEFSIWMTLEKWNVVRFIIALKKPRNVTHHIYHKPHYSNAEN